MTVFPKVLPIGNYIPNPVPQCIYTGGGGGGEALQYQNITTQLNPKVSPFAYFCARSSFAGMSTRSEMGQVPKEKEVAA